jgi:drug/metabolite transporter (DMT)-like permease
LLLKTGSGQPGLGASPPFSLVNLSTIGGAACFVVALGFYVMILQRLPLQLAQSILSIQFVAIALAAALVLGERATAIQYLGFALIASGIFLAAR